MPRIRLLLPKTDRSFTKIPNILVDKFLPMLKDTELRILLVLLRVTSGWNREGQPVILQYQRLMKLSGRHSEAVSEALKRLSKLGLIHKPSANRYRKSKFQDRQSEAQQYKEN